MVGIPSIITIDDYALLNKPKRLRPSKTRNWTARYRLISVAWMPLCWLPTSDLASGLFEDRSVHHRRQDRRYSEVDYFRNARHSGIIAKPSATSRDLFALTVETDMDRDQFAIGKEPFSVCSSKRRFYLPEVSEQLVIRSCE